MEPRGLVDVLPVTTDGDAGASVSVMRMGRSLASDPLTTDRMAASIPEAVRIRDRTIRIHCLYLSRRLMRKGDVMLTGTSVDRPVCLGPGLSASHEVMTAARVVKRCCSFDLRVSDRSVTMDVLTRALRMQLSIPPGVRLDIRAVLESGVVVRLSDDDQVQQVLQTHPDELTVRVSKGGVKRYSSFITIVVSLAKTVTSVLLATHLIRREYDDQGRKWLHAAGWVLLGCLLLGAAINLHCSFLILGQAKHDTIAVADWVTACPESVALGCVAALFNLLNLECMWSNHTLFRTINLHCPMPREMQAKTVRMSLKSVFVSDIVPIACSFIDFFTSTEHGLVATLSMVASVVSVLVTGVKKTVVLLLIGEDDEGRRDRTDEISAVDYATLLQPRTVTVLRLQLHGLEGSQLRSSAIAALVCRFHVECFGAVRRHRGVVLRFNHASVSAVFNGPSEDDAHAENAVKGAMEVAGRWDLARAEELAGQGSHDRAAVVMSGGVVTADALVGVLGTAMRREYQVIGPHWGTLRQLHALCECCGAEGTRVLVDEACGIAAREPVYLRPIDRVSPHANAGVHDHYTVYELLMPRSKLLRLRELDRRAVPMWQNVFAELTHGSVDGAASALEKYLESQTATDEIALALIRRLRRTIRDKLPHYARVMRSHFSDGLTEEPEGASQLRRLSRLESEEATTAVQNAAVAAQAELLKAQGVLLSATRAAVAASSTPVARRRRGSSAVRWSSASPKVGRRRSCGFGTAASGVNSPLTPVSDSGRRGSGSMSASLPGGSPEDLSVVPVNEPANGKEAVFETPRAEAISCPFGRERSLSVASPRSCFTDPIEPDGERKNSTGGRRRSSAGTEADVGRPPRAARAPAVVRLRPEPLVFELSGSAAVSSGLSGPSPDCATARRIGADGAETADPDAARSPTTDPSPRATDDGLAEVKAGALRLLREDGGRDDDEADAKTLRRLRFDDETPAGGTRQSGETSSSLSLSQSVRDFKSTVGTHAASLRRRPHLQAKEVPPSPPSGPPPTPPLPFREVAVPPAAISLLQLAVKAAPDAWPRAQSRPSPAAARAVPQL
eukprot:TRINITY_DN18050_c0_g1_i1.p1 TRINITY_DN18050_c0_g1~~TRINITY_DN18050_c0_g1_i1.p1  ORF type:complete len:1088 (+),score=372.51 TRINITY_DN18050_c0_g1_i1:46-3264(+)